MFYSLVPKSSEAYFMSRKTAKKNVRLNRFALNFTQIQIGTITKIPWLSRLLTKDEL